MMCMARCQLTSYDDDDLSNSMPQVSSTYQTTIDYDVAIIHIIHHRFVAMSVTSETKVSICFNIATREYLYVKLVPQRFFCQKSIPNIPFV